MDYSESMLVLCALVPNFLIGETAGASATLTNPNAFSSDINSCLFDQWMSGNLPVLASRVHCVGANRQGLCYGALSSPQFAACYNTDDLMAEFTGNVVLRTGNVKTGKPNTFRRDEGNYAPKRQANSEDYSPAFQRSLNFYDQNKQQFYSRGHLTSGQDFSDQYDVDRTYIVTNIAPQWQAFNQGNWEKLEKAVQQYANEKSSPGPLYIFTGTEDFLPSSRTQKNVKMKLKGSIVVPKYFWKAICDPEIRSSVVFVAENPNGMEEDSEDSETKTGGCDVATKGVPHLQTVKKGVLLCYSLVSLKSTPSLQFNLPSFTQNCDPSKRATFLDVYLAKSLQ